MSLIVFSHIVAFSVLFIAAISDLKTTEVPDIFPAIGVAAGLILHGLASYNTNMDVSTLLEIQLLLNSPLEWLQALGDPLIWSLVVGTVFSIYGWGLYIMGMWGGADAFAMSVLGFATPYSLTGPDVLFSINLFLNIMIVGMLYTLLFAFYKSVQNRGVWSQTWKDIKQQEKRITVEIILSAAICLIGVYTGSFNGLVYFIFLVSMIIIYRFLLNIQEDVLTREVSVSELEPGDVLASSEEQGGKVVGITQKEIDSIKAERVTIREGVRFIPVFPIALVLTSVLGGGISWMIILV